MILFPVDYDNRNYGAIIYLTDMGPYHTMVSISWGKDYGATKATYHQDYRSH